MINGCAIQLIWSPRPIAILLMWHHLSHSPFFFCIQRRQQQSPFIIEKKLDWMMSSPFSLNSIIRIEHLYYIYAIRRSNYAWLSYLLLIGNQFRNSIQFSIKFYKIPQRAINYIADCVGLLYVGLTQHWLNKVNLNQCWCLIDTMYSIMGVEYTAAVGGICIEAIIFISPKWKGTSI